MAHEAKMLCFNISGEEYAVDVDDVLGVNPMISMLHLPGAPDFIEGITRIKGKIIPLIDLKKRLAAGKGGYSGRSRIIIAKADKVRVGMIVDSVTGLMSIPDECVEKPAVVLSQAKFLKGVGNVEKRFFLILDMNKFMSEEESRALNEASEQIQGTGYRVQGSGE